MSWSMLRRVALGSLVAGLLTLPVDLLCLVLPELFRREAWQPLPPARGVSGSAQSWALDRVRTELKTPSVRRKTALEITPDSVFIAFELTLSRGHPLTDTVKRDQIRYMKLAFTREVFGVVTIGDQPLTDEDLPDVTWATDPNTGDLRLTVGGSRTVSRSALVRFRWADAGDRGPRATSTSSPLLSEELLALTAVLATNPPAGLPWVGLWLATVPPPGDEVLEVTLSDVTLQFCSAPLDSSNPRPLTVRREARGGPDTVDVYAAAAAKPEETIARKNYLRRLGRVWEPYHFPRWWVVPQFVLGLLNAVPLLAVLWFLACGPVAIPRAMVANILRAALALHVVITLQELGAAFAFTPPVAEVSKGIETWWQAHFPLNHGPVLGYGSVLLAPAVLGVLVPVWLGGSAAAAVGGSRSRSRRAAVVVSVLLFVASAVGVVAAALALAPGRVPGPSLAAAAGVFALWLGGGFWLLARLPGAAPRCRATGAAGAATLLTLALVVPASWTLWRAYPAWTAGVCGGLEVLSAASFLFAIVRYAHRGYACGGGRPPALTRWQRVGLAAAAVVAALPTGALFESGPGFSGLTYVQSFARHVDTLVLTLGLAVPVGLLAREGRTGLELPSWARPVGVLAGAALFFGTEAWAGVPVPFLLGLATLSWVVRDSAARTGLDAAAAAVARGGTDLLNRVLRLSLTADAVRQRRRALAQEVGKGALTVVQLQEKLTEAEQELAAVRRDAIFDGQPLRDVVLGVGPYPTAWANGRHGVRWSLLLGVPWLTLFLWNYLVGSTAAADPYLLWGMATGAAAVGLKWAGFGFVFGYFYPYLRGRNGMQKGVLFCGTLLLPQLPLLAVANDDAEAWRASGFWALQLFVHFTLLGVFAFDYAALRDDLRDWRMILEVHGLAWVGLSVSSIAAALIAAVTTLVTTGVTTVITAGLSSVFTPPPARLPGAVVATPGPPRAAASDDGQTADAKPHR